MKPKLYFEDKSIEDLHIIIDNGRKAKVLMTENIFFKDILVPALEADISGLEGSLVWQPGSTDKDISQIGLDRVWKSGILFGMAKLWQQLNKFKNDGIQAEKELGLRGD